MSSKVSKASKLVELTVERKNVKCNFCERSTIDSLMWGPMYQLQGITVHYFCMLFSAGLSQNGEDDEGIYGFLPKDIRIELNRGHKLKCKYCKGPKATVGCSVKQCKVSFHYPCGLNEGSLFQFINNYESFCFKHRKVPPIKVPKENWECCICFNDFNGEKFPLKPPCCNNNTGVFHRKCIMEMARNSGLHFFKCPLCNDKITFSEAMRLQGVYLPDRDATWEIEPNAFVELNQQYNKCDKQPCKCPNGREFTSEDNEGPWKIIRCGGCGAAGVHMKCENLQVFTYRCPTCCNVLKDYSVDDSEEDDDEDGTLSQRRGRNIARRREIRISRHQFELQSSDDDEPVYNILDQLPKFNLEEESSDSDDETEKSSVASVKKSMEEIPKRQNIFGRQYMLVGAFSENESLGEDENDDLEELEEDFVSANSASTSRPQNVRVMNDCEKVIDSKNRLVKIKNSCKNIHEQNTITQISFFKLKEKFSNLKVLSKQIAAKVVPKNDTTTQVRAGLAEVSRNGGKITEMVSNVGRIEMYPSDASLINLCKVPKIKPVQIDSIEEQSVERLERIFSAKLSEKLQIPTTPSQEADDWGPIIIDENQNDKPAPPKVTYIPTKEEKDDDIQIELVKIVKKPPTPVKKVDWRQNMATAYKQINDKPQVQQDIRQYSYASYYSGKLSAALKANTPSYIRSLTPQVNGIKANSGSGLQQQEVVDISLSSDEDDSNTPATTNITGPSDRLPMPNRDRDSKRVRADDKTATCKGGENSSSKRPKVFKK